MKHTIRFILIFLVLVIGNGHVRAITDEDVIINIQPNNTAGTATKSVSGMTVTITANPATGYSIDKDHIIAEKMINAMAPRRSSPGLASSLPITDNGGNSFSFTIPDGYTGAFVTVNFYETTANGITSLDQITDMSGTYVLTADVDAAGFTSKGEFTGTLDGGLHKIYNLSEPLFSSTNNNAVIRNITFEEINISESGNVGAVTREAKGASRIYNIGILSGSVGGTEYTGGLVGLLNGTSRVINCYSYATITGGTDVGGIVGYNNGTTTASSINTMVMNCMFYGDIIAGDNVSPVYGGNNINNLQGGLNTYNYYAYEKLKTKAITEGKYNCALAVEEKYLNRFEFYRLLLNSNKKLAAYYATGFTSNGNQMAKWVLETADRSISGHSPYPYPILKAQGYYPSIINYDAENAPDSSFVGRNKGGKLGKTLSVTISGTKTDGGQSWPTGASITTSSLTLQRTDKDFDRFNFNYDKVQLPYYNEVGTGNYTGNRVVTGWKIISITTINGDPYTSDNYDYDKKYSYNPEYFDYPNYNFANRKSSNKDLYSVSGRVFSQGAYFDVPYGVTSITIEPYWGKACYIADSKYDVVYKIDYTGKQNTSSTQVSTGATFNGEASQVIKTSVSDALSYITSTLGGFGPTVYDNAVVLVGNLHLDNVPSKDENPFTMMSVDMDKDKEPDYSLIYHHKNRTNICPIRFDFLAVPGTAQAQKPNGASLICNFTIFKTRGWFEVTNTAFMYSSQIEYENGALYNTGETVITKMDAPLILLGGVFDQFVSTQSSKVDGHTIYIHVGSNVWINSFGLGTHSDGKQSTPHVPVSVTGGDYEEFYLTGTYNANSNINNDNAECYISGGRFGEVAGASLEQIGDNYNNNNTKGNVRWQIYDADITSFFGGGINDTKPVKGNITTDIFNSHVDLFCGGPKFGNMATGKKVTTTAEGCTFGKYFGAGYGGTSLSRKKYYDLRATDWSTWAGDYVSDRGNYFDGKTTPAPGDSKYGNKGVGVATDFDYEFFVWSSGETGGRFFVKFAAFSLAQCNDVSSTLKKCTVETNFYGGGNLGKVVGTATSELEDCTIKGSVYGAGYSASLPSVEVRDAGFTKNPNYNSASGMFEPGEFSGTTTFTWQNATEAGKTLSDGNPGSDLTYYYLYTGVELTDLGEVQTTNLTIKGTTTVGESVYGGGEESGVGGNTTITVNNGSIGVGNTGRFGYRWGNVYGGGKGKIDDNTGKLTISTIEDLDAGLVKGNTTITINGGTILHNVYGGGAVGSVGTFTRDNTTGMPTACAVNTGLATVTVNGGTIGHDKKDTGMVNGSSRGWEGNPNGTGAFAFLNQLAWVNNTNVIIGDATTSSEDKGPSIWGSVYGGGENGHNFENGVVTVNKGTIGDKNGTWDCGNVYGAGCGTDTFSRDDNENGEIEESEKNHHNPMAGIVRGTTSVTVNGGIILRNVYGGGSMGSVGTYTYVNGLPTTCATGTGSTTININGGTIGETDTDYGNVFGGPKGNLSETEFSASAGETLVNINAHPTDATKNPVIWGSVFGGGEAGIVEQNTTVNISGGSVNQSVYGGGCEADVKGNTNVSMTDGYIFNGIFGGGLSGSVGTFTRSTDPSKVNIFGHTTHDGCIGKPIACAEGTGKCTIVVSGGQIGPIEVATQGMNRLDAQGGPVPEGWVWGGGRGLVQSPTENPDVHFTAYVNETDVTIKDNAFILESIIGGGEFGRVLGNTKVKIQGGQIGVGANQTEGDKPKRYADDKFVDPSVTPITNDNALEPCSHYQYGKLVGDIKVYDTYDPYADKYKQAHDGSVPTGLEGGSTDNASDGKTWIGCVFGGGSGYFPYKETDTDGKITDYGWVQSAGWVEGNTELIISGGHILSNVYGANEYTTVQGKSTVTMTGGTIGVPRTQAQIKASPKLGHLFGGGKGDPRPYFNNKTNAGSVEIAISGGIIYGSVFGGGESGTVKGGVTVSMTGGVVLSDVYGGGALADTQTDNWDATKNSGTGGWATGKTSASSTTTVRLTGGNILGEAYGGGLGETGSPAYVYGDVLLDLNGTTTSGEEGTSIDAIERGCAVNQVFGCNNAAGSPMGAVTVHVYATQNKAKSQIGNTDGETPVTDAKTKGVYDVAAVYGGGNQAAYEPADADNNKTEVIIDGCGLTSIQQVYGGGNAACTPSTNVTVNGTFEIEELFGGGNGLDDILIDGVTMPNPGANVGYKNYSEYYQEEGSTTWLVRDKADYDTKDERTAATDPETGIVYGTGKASVNIYGGTVHRVFGGSNTKGNVRLTAVTLLEEQEGEDCCPFQVDEAYGGGKSAEMDAEAQLLMACIPGLKAAYGGAEAADVRGNVTLNITNGTFDRVFGGNNLSGTIAGSITINVEEIGCRPVKIGELYGGGNQAGYSVYGYKEVNKGTELEPVMVWVPRESATDDGTGPETPYDDPQVNVMSFTSIGSIYGGGYGDGAKMVGNPTVNINEAYGRYYNVDASVVGENAKTPNDYPIPSHAKGKIGAINKVFGGGNAAKVIGNTTVNIGTLKEIYVVKKVAVGDPVTDYYTRNNDGTYTAGTGTAVDGTTYYEKIPVVGADIRDNVYGGGNNADVTGNANVNIGEKKTE